MHSFHSPCAVLANRVVHCVRRKVEIARPCNRAEHDFRLMKNIFIAQGRKHASRWRMDQIGKLDRTLDAVIETYVKAKSR